MKFLDHDAVNALTGPRSRVQRWRDIRDDQFPPPVFDGQRKRWPDREIESFLAWRLALRDGATQAMRWSDWLAEQKKKEAAA
jgi:predicted DNA-binding transcriptional regulator AlpA